MSTTNAVTVSIEVAVEPRTAFAIFTEEIDRWWRPGPINWNNSRRAVGIRFEPGVGGRWLEVYDEAAGDVMEHGRILVWEPGERLVFSYRDAGHDIDGTEVEVRFEAVGDGSTRVTLEHRGWDHVPADVAGRKRQLKRSGWANIMGWYSDWAFWGSPRRVRPEAPAAESVPVREGDAESLLLAPLAGLTLSSPGADLAIAEWKAAGGPPGPPRYVAPFHVHEKDDEIWYVLEGTLRFRLGDRELDAPAGSAVLAPRGVPHTFWNPGEESARYLVVMTSGIRRLIEELHTDAGRVPEARPGIFRKHASQLLA